ncbi:CG33234 [Drosophila busckii]|uniref:CG33234 n=1 Tax=Drosophila busckii TaxID=30019 RepID=A0A0M4F688_DROBS|nr:organic cation/carnitine transporter 7 isoform X2 [Drosophila busckii]ALC47537.1 CG33234 [Drosophila busckii]
MNKQTPTTSPVDIDDVLKELGFGRMQIFIFVGCFLMQIYVTNEQFGIGLLSVPASCDIDMSGYRVSWMLALGMCSQILFSHYWGHFADERGRRMQLIVSLLTCMVLSLLTSLMPEYWSFLVCRFFVGCFLTGPGMGLVTYMSEFTKISLRPKVLIYLSYSQGIGMVYVAAMAMALLPSDIKIRLVGDYGITSWRILFWINLLPGIAGLIIVWLSPESPKYYLSIHKEQEAMAVLEKCCRVNKGKDVTLKSLGIEYVTQPRRRSEVEVKFRSRNPFVRLWVNTKPLFRGKHLRFMLLALTLSFTLFATGFGLAIWIVRIFEATEDTGGKATLCELMYEHAMRKKEKNDTSFCVIELETLEYSMIIGVVCLCFFIVISLLLICLNRKTIIISFSFIAGCSGFLLNFVHWKPMVLIALIFLSMPSLCSLRLVHSVLVDVIPTHLRSKAMALSTMMGRFGTMLAMIYVGYTYQVFCPITFNLFVVIILLSGGLMFLLPKDAAADIANE